MKIDTYYQDYNQLLSKKLSISQRFFHVVVSIFIVPFRFLQFLMGRFLAHLIFNPLFRQQEKKINWMNNKQKYPDPVLSKNDQCVIVNLDESTGFLRRTSANWFYSIENSFRRIMGLSLKKRELQSSNTLQKFMGQVDNLIRQGTNPNKIYLKGLYFLLEKQRELILDKLSHRHHYNFRKNIEQYLFYLLKLDTGEALDSVEIRGPKVMRQPMRERKFIISCLPRTNNYEVLFLEHRYIANQLNATVIGFNYRGTGGSRGLLATQHDMCQDAMAQVKRLLALGARPENIALTGECLGGAIATKVAAELHRKKLPIKLLNVRSFRSLLGLIRGRILPDNSTNVWHPVYWMRFLAAHLVTLIVAPLLWLSGWFISVEKDWKSIPMADKDYLVVRSKRDKLGKHFRDDTMISHSYASIYSLQKEEQMELHEKIKKGEHLSSEELMRVKEPRGKHKFYVDPVKRKDAKQVDGHVCHLRYLSPRKPDLSESTDGREYSINFFKRVWGKCKLDDKTASLSLAA